MSGRCDAVERCSRYPAARVSAGLSETYNLSVIHATPKQTPSRTFAVLIRYDKDVSTSVCGVCGYVRCSLNSSKT